MMRRYDCRTGVDKGYLKVSHWMGGCASVSLHSEGKIENMCVIVAKEDIPDLIDTLRAISCMCGVE